MESNSNIDFSKFTKALNHLELQYDNFKELSSDLPELIKEAVVESVIHRFEICYDTLWKTLKRYLFIELGLPDVPNSPKKVIRMAAENKLFVSSTEQWMGYAIARINTAHDYSFKKAKDALKLMEYFIDDSKQLLQTLTDNSTTGK